MPLPKGLHDGLSIFTQEETRLVRATAVLFDFDLQPSVRKLHLHPSCVFARLMVPVFEGNVRVGAGTVFAIGNKVMALLSFDYETPERFDLSIGRNVYAIPKLAYYLDPDQKEGYTVDFIDVERIDLSAQPSNDPAISSALTTTEYNQL